MSERLHGVPTPEGEYFDSGRFAGLSFVLGVVAVIALVLCAVGAIVHPHQFGYSWLLLLRFSSRCVPAAFSGQLCIMQPMPNGAWWCAGNWKILVHY